MPTVRPIRTALWVAVLLSCSDGRGGEQRASDSAPSARIDVSPGRTFQTISGWEASGQLGEVDCHPHALQRYRAEVVDRAVNELGITRLRLDLRSGVESPVDTWPLYRAGTMSYPAWRGTWMVAQNDNDDPAVANPQGFQWGKLDHTVEQVILPIRRALAARGERLFVNLNYVDFYLGAGSKAFSHFEDPEEYAELVRVVFDHLNEQYGFVPDGLEVLLEPENTPHGAIAMGRAIVAVVRRLADGGYHPVIIAPSTTRAANAPAFYDAMLTVPGVAGLIGELSYHRYTGVSRPTLEAIAARASRDRIRTGMLEHIGSGFADLYEDLTVANVSAWEQFTLAYCGQRTNPDADAVYFQINQADTLAPQVTLTRMSRLFRQVFLYVRPGAVRLGATSNASALRPLAFRNVNGTTVVVGWTDAAMSFGVRGLPAGRYGINYSTTHGAYNETLPEAVVASGAELQVPMPAAGVVTVYAK